MSATQTLRASEPFPMVHSNWSDAHRSHYGFTEPEQMPYNGARSDAHVQPAATPLFQPEEAAFINSFLDQPPDAFGNSLDIFGDNAHISQNYEWLLSEAPPSLRDVSTGPPSTRPHFSHSYSTGHHPLSVQTDLGHFQGGPSHPMSAPVAHHDMMSAGPHMMPQSARPAEHFQMHHQMSPPARTSRTQSVSIPSQHSTHTPVFPTAATTAAALQNALKHRRKTSDSVADRLIFNLKPYDDDSEAMAANMAATFSESAPTPPMLEVKPQPPRPTHIRAHSESFAAFSNRPEGGEGQDPRRLYRFGSDRHFSINGFVRTDNEPSEHQLTQQLLDNNYGAISGGPISADQSRAASPVGLKKRRAEDEDSDLDSPAKRQRGDMPMSARRISASKEWRRRASTVASQGGPVSPTLKRRKSSPPLPGNSAKKPPRENLTEEQKRSNHIVSEQKRRNLIKQGFEELNILVPALREGGFSKSNVLIETAQHLENIIKGNEELREQMAAFGLS